jgi:hypothetical protein
VRSTIVSLLVTLLCASCQGHGGAVSVRWQIEDLTTGQLYYPSDVAGNNDVCTQTMPTPWAITQVLLVISPPGMPAPSPSPEDCKAEQPSCFSFKCAQREATTPFSLVPGSFALSLQAIGAPGTTAITPAPSVRTIKRNELVNLDVIEIGVNPLPTVPFTDGGEPPDMGSADSGPVM